MHCPYSRKMFTTVNKALATAKAPGVECQVVHTCQPWHEQATVLHEVALSVNKLKPESYRDTLAKIYETWDNWTDKNARGLSREELKAKCIKLCVPEALSEQVMKTITRSTESKGNGPSDAMQLLKHHTRSHRTLGVHVTPTVFVNGYEAGKISSGWPAEKWVGFLELLEAQK